MISLANMINVTTIPRSSPLQIRQESKLVVNMLSSISGFGAVKPHGVAGTRGTWNMEHVYPCCASSWTDVGKQETVEA